MLRVKPYYSFLQHLVTVQQDHQTMKWQYENSSFSVERRADLWGVIVQLIMSLPAVHYIYLYLQ